MSDPDPDEYDLSQRTLPGRGFGRVTLDIDPGETDSSLEQTSQPREPASSFTDKTRAVSAAGDPRVAAMRELYAAGDADAARFIAETIDPTPVGRVSFEDETLGEARAKPTAADDGRTVVGSAGANLAAVISRSSVPRLVRRATDLEALPIDHRAGFLLAHIDSKTTMQELLDVCAMPEGDAVEIVRQLTSMGIIVLT